MTEHEVKITIIVEDLVTGATMTAEIPRAKFFERTIFGMDPGPIEADSFRPRRNDPPAKHRIEFQPIRADDGSYMTLRATP